MIDILCFRRVAQMSVCTLLALSIMPLGIGSAQSTSIPPDKDIQATIERTSAAFARCESGICDAHFPQAIAELCALEAIEPSRRIPQIALYLSVASEEAAYPLLGAIAKYGDLPPREVVKALVPFLSVSNTRQQKFIHGFLRRAENPVVGERPDYSHFAFALKNSEANPDAQLMSYLFRRYPSSAVLLLMSEWLPAGDRNIVWATHSIDDWNWKHKHGFDAHAETARLEAIKSVQRLAEHDRWWVRYYAVSVLAKYPALRDVSVMNSLRKDDHPLVKRLLMGLDGT